MRLKGGFIPTTKHAAIVQAGMRSGAIRPVVTPGGGTLGNRMVI
tara:strand:+ start:1560 stop:1691 length:132 start_codon:yes stop_codon:yes gene_type:complete